MTTPKQPANGWESPFDLKAAGDAMDRLSRVVSGNDNLIAEPGLVQALVQGNATPQQAQAINQFLDGLNAEMAVRVASQAGTKIALSPSQQGALQRMGIPFESVLLTQKDAVQQLTDEMAKQGLKPVMDEQGNVQVDASGNPLAEKAEPKKQKRKGFARLLHNLGNNPVTSLIVTGNLDTRTPLADLGGGPGLAGNAHAANVGYQWANAQLSENIGGARDALAGKPFDPKAAAVGASSDDMALAERLGYDPNSFFSMQAFKAAGYAHNDTSHLAKGWDEANPDGLFGMDGQAAVTEAEVFANDPAKYRQGIINNPDLSAEQVAERLKAISSDQFATLARKVSGLRATVGTDFARGIGIEPGTTAFQATSATADILASFLVDPTNLAVTAWSGARRAAAAVDNFADADSIRRVFGTHAKSARFLQDAVDGANELRAAHAAGDTVAMTKIKARLDASNPFAAFLDDFTGTNQILPNAKGGPQILEGNALDEAIKHKDLPFAYGAGKPITTFDDAVEYFASKSALLRLQGGLAPVETRYMPGALSSYGYKKLRGSLASWSAGRSVEKSLSRKETFKRWAADPMRSSGDLIKGDHELVRFVPQADNAVDYATGRVISAPERTGMASAARGSEVVLTDAGEGQIRRNMLDYGRAVAPETALGKVAAWSTTGMAQRAKLVAARLSNWIPRDTEVVLASSEAGDVMQKTARLFMTPGDARLLGARWSLADDAERKAIAQGVEEQLWHAAGLPRTKAGREFIAKRRTEFEQYMTDGKGAVDARGRPVAMFPGQVQERFTFSSFGALHKASARAGIYEATMGRLLSTESFNYLLTQWKLGVLFGGVTAARANTESWLASAADHQFAGGLAAKAALKEQGRLTGAYLHRTRPFDKAANLPVLRDLGRFYRHALLKKVPPDIQKEIAELPDDILLPAVSEQAALHLALNVDPANINEASELAMRGFARQQVFFNTTEGFNTAVKNRLGYELTDELAGLQGVNTYAHNLGIRVNKAPNVAKAMLDSIEGTATVDDVVKALDSNTARRLMAQTKYGRVYWEGDVQREALTDAEKALGKQQWAERITNEFRGLLTGRNGRFNKKIAEHIRANGKAPDADWLLDHVKEMDRPEKMLKPIFADIPADFDGTVKSFVESTLRYEGRAYQWMVERQIQRMTTAPHFTYAYADAKVALNRTFKAQLIKGGLPEAAAEKATQAVAQRQGWSRIARMVDDPQMRSQLDIAGRGFFSFSRATTMMLRRWGDVLWRNPEAARRMQLAAEGTVQSGLVYKDENGEWNFHLPATGVAQEALLHAASHIPGMHGLVKIPVSDFTGRVTTIIPGSDNPLQYSTTPMISISGRKVAELFPRQRELFDMIDRKLNGRMGQGKGIVDTLTPPMFNRFFQSMGDDERNTVLSSAMIGSLYHMYAAGQVPPEGASPSEMDQFWQNLKTGTRSQLFLRAMLGTFSPASIDVPDGGKNADYAWAASGAQNLRDEFKRLLKDTDGDFARATAIWTALHPDMAVYTESASHVTLSKAVLPATKAALDWMQDNAEFMKKYKSVAGYFIPPQKAGEPYSQDAYRAQLEMHLRERKTPKEFYEQVRIHTDADEYYTMKDKFDAEIAKATGEGNDDYAKARKDQWEQWSRDFKSTHPLFDANLKAGSAERQTLAAAQLKDLRRMVTTDDIPSGVSKQALAGMIQAYDGYKKFLDTHRGSTNLVRAQRSQAFHAYEDYLLGVVAARPELKGVYRAVFDTLNSNLANIAINV